VIFLLQNIIPFYFLNRLWPLVFIGVGAYLLYIALRQRKRRESDSAGSVPTSIDFGPREDI
jgi:hypothetical protein